MPSLARENRYEDAIALAPLFFRYSEADWVLIDLAESRNLPVIGTVDLRKVEGRRLFCKRKEFVYPLQKGNRATKFIYDQKSLNVFWDAQRKKYDIALKSYKFIYGDSLEPADFFLVPD